MVVDSLFGSNVGASAIMPGRLQSLNGLSEDKLGQFAEALCPVSDLKRSFCRS